VADYSRIRQKNLLNQAEGYLDLICLFPDRWHLSPEIRDRLGERSLETLASIRQTSANRFHVLYLTGHAYRVLERYREAIAPLQEAAELDPEEISVWLALGWCYKRLGKLPLAIESLESALSFSDDLAIVHYNLACYWALSQNVPMAVLFLAQAFELDGSYRERVATESDFDPIRKDPHFDALVSKVIV